MRQALNLLRQVGRQPCGVVATDVDTKTVDDGYVERSTTMRRRRSAQRHDATGPRSKASAADDRASDARALAAGPSSASLMPHEQACSAEDVSGPECASDDVGAAPVTDITS